MRALLLLSLFACSATAQITATAPVLPGPTSQDIPVATGIGRYQQWYRATQLTGTITEPVRMTQIQFLSAGIPGALPAELDVELLIGHGKLSQVTGTFSNNFDGPSVLAVPQTQVTLTAGPAGSVALTLPFVNLFTWDQTRPVLIELRIYGNNQNDQPFTFGLQGTNTLFGQISRVYANGSPGAINGTVSSGAGLVTRFTARQGVQLDYGVGCAGEGNFVPINDMLQIPSPGIQWTNRLLEAPSGQPAFWVIGDQDAFPLQFDLGPLFGLPNTGCLLLTNPVNVIGPIIPVGGGPGSGFASLSIQLPGIPFSGARWFTQWVVFDPNAPNGAFAVTAGKRIIVAPIGG